MLLVTGVTTIRAAFRVWIEETVPLLQSGAIPKFDSDVIKTLGRDTVVELIDRFAPTAPRLVAIDTDSPSNPRRVILATNKKLDRSSSIASRWRAAGNAWLTWTQVLSATILVVLCTALPSCSDRRVAPDLRGTWVAASTTRYEGGKQTISGMPQFLGAEARFRFTASATGYTIDQLREDGLTVKLALTIEPITDRYYRGRLEFLSEDGSEVMKGRAPNAIPYLLLDLMPNEIRAAIFTDDTKATPAGFGEPANGKGKLEARLQRQKR